jgi:hypothetical protein
MGGDSRIVIEFASTNNFVRAYTELESSEFSSIIEDRELARGAPAEFHLTTDESSNIVYLIRPEGFYFSNHFANMFDVDSGKRVINNPPVVLNGETQNIIEVWHDLAKFNTSFGFETKKT